MLRSVHVQPSTSSPKPRVLESSSTKDKEEWHKQLFQSLKDQIDEAASELKSQPFEQPQTSTTTEEALKKKSRGRSTPAGELTSVSFRIPEAFYRNDIGLDFEKLVPLGEHEIANNRNQTRFSLAQRLEGWSIKRKLRPSKKDKFDLYYHHEEAKRQFRSNPEVVKFILYEAYPTTNKDENRTEIKKSRKREQTLEEFPTSARDSLNHWPILGERPTSCHLNNLEAVPNHTMNSDVVEDAANDDQHLNANDDNLEELLQDFRTDWERENQLP